MYTFSMIVSIHSQTECLKNAYNEKIIQEEKMKKMETIFIYDHINWRIIIFTKKNWYILNWSYIYYCSTKLIFCTFPGPNRTNDKDYLSLDTTCKPSDNTPGNDAANNTRKPDDVTVSGETPRISGGLRRVIGIRKTRPRIQVSPLIVLLNSFSLYMSLYSSM